MTSHFHTLTDSDQRALAPMYDPAFERDACGVGLVVDIHGRQSRDIVERALAGLVNLTHRGGVGADARTGDGAGILTQLPDELYGAELARLGAGAVGAGEYGVGMLFFPAGDGAADGRPADVVLLLVGPMGDPRLMLRVLARMARLVRQRTLLDDLRAAADADSLRHALAGADQA